MTDTKPQQTQDPTGDRPEGNFRSRARGLAAVTLVAVGLTLAACSSSGSASPPSTSKSTTSTTTAAGGGSSSKSTTIVIRNFTFSPASTTVSPGATVTVDNEDQVAHTITSSKGGFNTGDIQPGQSKTFTAPNTAGTYPYICSIHQYMTGTLTVS